MQVEVMRQIFSNDERKQLIVQPKGHGKSHVMQLLGICLKGTHLIIHPLLVLTSDHAPSFQTGNEEYGVIEADNLDKCASMLSSHRQDIIQRIIGLHKNTTSTIFLFASPQFLARNKDF